MSKNKNLHLAKKNKNDEFYTRLEDIENELKHYKEHFRGKKIYCNCDDPRVSNFFHYFSYRFEDLKLKKLTAMCYKNQEMDLFTTHANEKAISLEYHGIKNIKPDEDKIPVVEDIGIKYLEGDGDFRSQESIELLKEADIVVTNPPFSLFRDYVSQLVEYDKKFIIVGSVNAITYKQIFPLLKENKLWLGVTMPQKFLSGEVNSIVSIAALWYTNIQHKKRKEKLILYKKYDKNEYITYDNYNAINVDKVADIPCDYEGLMGVPITFLTKYNPEQFEIIALDCEIAWQNIKDLKKEHKLNNYSAGYINGRRLYARILIKRK